ncbi:hypothetical protein OH76DRAFT_1399101 [Lentinus brumalis]|uniref:Uncharacterized protein n=1 Tax=Lentinus brumalis TaxID=2498619 RepID=A0A371DN08_9APHY|nr:hypothetical protein OH76DRAFT_1399101 [Polyporus brumalis]
MPRSARPGPLQEMDLRSVPVPSQSTTPSHLRPNKRPHSPSVGSADSPSKRRFKAVDGSITPRLKSPLSASSNSARFAPALFHALLQGQDSPAARLDFGSSDASDTTVCEAPRGSGGGSETPRRSTRRTPSTRARRSPRLSAGPLGSPSRSSRPSHTGQTGAVVDPDSAATRASRALPLFIPREVSPPDRQSIHYPGFDVYQDPYTIIPVAPSPRLAADEDSVSSIVDNEDDKENRAPRRKSSKKTHDPVTPSELAWMKAGLVSPCAILRRSAKKLGPPSPHPKHVANFRATPRERTLRPVVSPAATLVGATPGRTPLGKEERRQMRRAMEEEMDCFEGEDELV